MLRWTLGVMLGGGLILLGMIAWRPAGVMGGWAGVVPGALVGRVRADVPGLNSAWGAALVAGGEFVLMWLVLDDLYPDAASWLGGGLKLLAVLVFWGSLALVACEALGL